MSRGELCQLLSQYKRKNAPAGACAMAFSGFWRSATWGMTPDTWCRSDIKTVMIIGAGPIVIGQACEFDYSGTQACKALKAEGYRVILLNSNPATIMTDPGTADRTYIGPMTPALVEQVQHSYCDVRGVCPRV